MPQHHHTPKPHPTGTTLIRLADIPPHTRIRAAHQLMAQAKDQAEYTKLLQLAYHPGHASGRIAA